MIRMRIKVQTPGWVSGGYENTVYFETVEQANEWLLQNTNCKLYSAEEVSDESFLEDYIGEL